ncbi:hypothetical protein D9M71_763670 [compost metagenome]
MRTLSLPFWAKYSSLLVLAWATVMVLRSPSWPSSAICPLPDWPPSLAPTVVVFFMSTRFSLPMLDTLAE